MAARSRSSPYRVHGSQATAHWVGPSGCSANLRPNVEGMADHTVGGFEAAQGGTFGRAPAGAGRHRGDHALTNELSVPRAGKCCAARLLSDKSSRLAVSSPGIVPQARSRTELPCCQSPGLPSTESRRIHPISASASAFNSALCLRLWKAIPPRRNVPFFRIVLALSGGTSHRRAAARSGRVWVLLERNPPNRPLAPVGTPASGRESNPAPHKTKRN